MKMSSKARYSLFVVVALTKQYNTQEYIPVTVLAKCTGVTERYLEQILALLKKDNIVTATRGASGGYRLADHPDNISVGRVLRCVEDNLNLVDCLANKCDNAKCVSKNLWVNLHHHINSYLDTITLSQMTEDNL